MSDIKEEEKHVKLDYAIESLDDVRYQAYCILERIQGGASGCDKKDADVKPVSNLQSVLASGSDRIWKKNDEIRAILNDIESAIF